MPSDPRPVTTATLRDWPLPSADGGKESRGRTLVVGGTSRTPGSVLLAAEALLRSGAGKLQVATAQSVAAALSVAVPEAMVCPLPETADGEIDPSAAGTVLDLAGDCAAVLLGPGLMDPDNAEALLAGIVPKLSCTVVVDAVGMAYLTAHPEGLGHLEGRRGAHPEPDRARDHPRHGRGRGGRRPRRRPSCGSPRRRARPWCPAPPPPGSPRPTGEVWVVDTGGPGLGVSGSGDVKVGDHHRSLRPRLPAGAGRRLGHLPARSGR